METITGRTIEERRNEPERFGVGFSLNSEFRFLDEGIEILDWERFLEYAKDRVIHTRIFARFTCGCGHSQLLEVRRHYENPEIFIASGTCEKCGCGGICVITGNSDF